ncbi:X2-like carbohydrate binding domain-containing protein [Paenibacillus sp. GYB004]|uniref:X2-like carbohydrate binding domain-containing protein n=1 Tax=Paenibacillus sp. GYB004 TaxID=2994393 RepID=UPI002F961189
MTERKDRKDRNSEYRKGVLRRLHQIGTWRGRGGASGILRESRRSGRGLAAVTRTAIAALLVVCMVLEILAVSGPVAAAEPVNLVKNAGFEIGAAAPDDWSRGAAGTWEWDAAVSHTGSRSAKLITQGSTEIAFFSQSYIPVQPGKLYEFSSYFKPQNITGRAFILLAWYSAPNAAGFLSQKVLDVDRSAAGWSRAAMQETAPAGAQYAHVAVHMRGGAGTIWYDDVSLTRVIRNSVVEPTAAQFDKNAARQQDIPLRVTANGNSLLQIRNGGYVLQPGGDYTATTGEIVLKKEYLAGQPAGTAILTFVFDEGEERQVELNVTDSTGLSVPSLMYYKQASAPQPLTVTVSAYAGTLGGLRIGGSPLPEGEAYTVSGLDVTFREPYLNSLPPQTYIVHFDFAGGAASSITIDIKAITSSKTRSTIYTPAKVQAARSNVLAYGWASQSRNAAVTRAEAYFQSDGFAQDGYDFFWKAVPPQTLRRSYAVNETMGSPVTGRDIDRFGAYPYQGDPINEPWKIVDPSSGYKFPTNDFGAYYESGLDGKGIFRPELADRSLLVNTLYPEKGPGWGVDDGFGWVDGSGNRYPFIAYYAHRFVWYGERNAFLVDALKSMRDAYLYTGDAKYARAGLVMLDRIADVYPELDTSVYKAPYLHNGAEGKGKAVGAIWETFLIKELLSAYDAFFPEREDALLIAFLHQKAGELGLDNPKINGAAISRNIEDRIVSQVYPAIRNGDILGNTGMHQSALAMAAVVYDTLPQTKEWLDFTFQAGGALYNPARVTGGNVLPSLVNRVDRDGHPDEASPEYNSYWLNQFRTTADILQGYDLYPGADLYGNLKLKTLFSGLSPLVLSDNYMPTIGDSGRTGNPAVWLSLDHYVKAFQTFGDPGFAQMAYFLNGNSTAGIHGDIFSSDPEGVAAQIGSVIAAHGPLKQESANLTGYGFTALRDGTASEETLRDLWMYYGRTIYHGHRDALNIGLHAFGLDLSPDLGYPEFTDSRDMHRFHFVRNTVSHNTVVVDRSQQQPQWVSTPLHFDDGERVKLIDVEADDVYPQTTTYRRTTATIRVDDANSYIVDLFRVKGGSEHHFSFHGAEGGVTTDGLNLTAQPAGTYAGPNVEYGQRVDSVEGTGYMGSGFHYLKRVERDDSPANAFSVDWGVEDTWNVYGLGMGAPTDVRLRLTMMGTFDEVALADGIPPQNKPGNPESLRYVLASRAGTDLDSLFASVIEPYRGSRHIQSIAPVQVKAGAAVVTGSEAAAIKVVLADGRTDYIVNALNPDIVYTVDDKLTFQGFFGVVSERGGQPEYGYLHDGTVLQANGQSLIATSLAAVEGSIAGFTKQLVWENEIVVAADAPLSPGVLPERAHIYVENDGTRNAAYEIKSVQERAGGGYALSIGDKTLIRQYANDADMAAGYAYDIAEGAAFRIPLTATWESAALLLEELRGRIEGEASSGRMSAVLSGQLLYRLSIIGLLAGQGQQATAADYMRDMLAYIGAPSVLQQGLLTEAALAAIGADAGAILAKWGS